MSDPKHAVGIDLGTTHCAVASVEVLGSDRVAAADDLATAIDEAMAWADERAAQGSIGIVATGSVITAGEVRSMLRGAP